MKQLENIVTIEGGHTATLVKRNDKAAIYKRETAEGQFVSYEVFAILTKDGMEIYPNQAAVRNRWCVCPLNEAKANVWFDRYTNGEVTFANVDPVTGDPIEATDNRNLDELPDVNVSVSDTTPAETEPTVVTEPVVEVAVESSPAVEIPTVEDPTAPPEVEIPTVEVPDVVPTADGGAVVTVAKVRQAKVYPTMKLPVGEFLRDDFAELNGMDHHPAHSDSYGPLMREIKEGRVIELRKEQRGKGRPRSIYTAVTPTTV